MSLPRARLAVQYSLLARFRKRISRREIAVRKPHISRISARGASPRERLGPGPFRLPLALVRSLLEEENSQQAERCDDGDDSVVFRSRNIADEKRQRAEEHSQAVQHQYSTLLAESKVGEPVRGVVFAG